jgi:hypothetical protein
VQIAVHNPRDHKEPIQNKVFAPTCASQHLHKKGRDLGHKELSRQREAPIIIEISRKMAKAKIVNNKWVRLDAQIYPNQYDFIKQVSKDQDVNMAEVARAMLSIAAYFIKGDIEKAQEYAKTYLPHVSAETVEKYFR